MHYQDEVVVLIPSLNPDDRLIKLINNLIENEFHNIIIVNDGSTEEYNKYFDELSEKAIILKHEVNLGKGRALKTGFNEFLKSFKNKKGVITVDADGQHKIEDIKKVSKRLAKEEKSLILGSRNFNEKEVPFTSKYGNKITRTVFTFLTGIKIKDTQTGLRGISSEYIVDLMNISGERFEYETNMLMYAKQNNIEIIEEPISTVYIEKNSSSHFNPLTDAFKIYMIFFKYVLSSLVSFIVDIILYKLIFNFFIGIVANYAVAIATIGARIVSSFVNYKVNKNKVFKSCSKNAIIKYYFLCVIQMFASAIIVSCIFNMIGQRGEVLIKIIVDIIIFFINFKIQNQWVFRGQKHK